MSSIVSGLINFGYNRTFLEPVWTVFLLVLLSIAVIDPQQLSVSLLFMGDTFVLIVPFILASSLIYAYVTATQADSLIADALQGRPSVVILTAAMFGALSPFCSCGVIPLIAAMLAMGVPLAPVMAFWIASPIIDPVMYLLTAGIVSWEFATMKALGAIVLGLVAGWSVYLAQKAGYLVNPLKPSVTGDTTTLSHVDKPVWRFWEEAPRKAVFIEKTTNIMTLLLKWLALAFLLESLLVAYVPTEWVTSSFGGDTQTPILWAAIIGVPAYINGYVAVPLIAELINKGMQPGAGMAFLIAGGITSIPAMIAVVAVARIQVVIFYVSFALIGSFAWGLIYQLWV
ncbi:permease [Enterovibrio norvegicus FF-33]|uniref:permease n=1 Tax=Enterovibrio TaxID=188143 RepID=UPI0003011045|nr:permease [Enterovibrio norvegicus]OEE67499.1 permease [Enterovibrio norvegicus FF-33]